MHVQITSKNWNLPENERQALERRIDKLRKKLPHMNVDLLHLVVRVDRHARRDEYNCYARLLMPGRVIPAHGVFQKYAAGAIADAFDELERKVEKRVKAKR